jgi:hypothetical protein
MIYSFPHDRRKIGLIPEERISRNNTTEFENEMGVNFEIFQNRIEAKLKRKEMWDHEKEAPKFRRIFRVYELDEEE